MNKIITIGREFGSGGRELAHHLAKELGFAYYDKEIVEEIAKRTNLAQHYVQHIVEHKSAVFFPITTGRTLHTAGSDYMMRQYTEVYSQQANVLREMAEKSDCIIVGRCADYILKDMNPTRIFVYADMQAKIQRCRKNAPEHEHLSDHQMKKMIQKVDKNRAKYYRHYTGQVWGDRENYELCVNTSISPIEDIAHALSHLI
ncbi:MAG: cytidylate kinase-like family protein [Ruminococcaceae bacterium]|nr:cytidylate kinase-like family protein [Oscillospiraceae bacterium]